MSHITLTADINSLHQANNFLHTQIDINHPKLKMIELAIEEIFVNIINYAYPNPDKTKNSSQINLVEFGVRKIRFDNQPFYAIWMRDWGKTFDPFEDVSSPNLDLSVEERPIGGLGLHLVKTISNHQCYSADDGSNIIEIYFSAYE